ncbi:HlyD family type I secretion periplasmic adaptor subunit [Terrarubrum flagellatum]|uniref:HlyD family type I secretion periplasmic adaptor subunit n=1 Tax=Terrirubrum flagellatum TaxID=2895980 RepID=UPI0031453E7C
MSPDAPDSEMERSRSATARSIHNHALAGLFVTLGLIGGLAGWSALARVSGAVIAQGQVAVESSSKKVQHPEGGVVAELRARDGDRVKAGDLLIRLDDTVVRANLAILAKSYDELTAQQARLAAERDEAAEIRFPDALLKRATTDADAQAAIAGQVTIFKSRRTARETGRTQLKEQIRQLQASIEGLIAQRAARESELTLIAEELKGVRELYAKNLAPIARVNALDRDRTRIEGERGKLIADIAAARGSIAEKDIQIARADDDFRSEVVKDLSAAISKLNETVERKIAAEDRLARIEIRAPATGMIHQQSVFTVGGVLGPGEAAMYVVPENDKLVVDAMVEPQDIEHVHFGQRVEVKFSGFADRNIKLSSGEVASISPDLIEDQQTRRRFYKIKVSVEPPKNAEGKPLALIPGMPAEAFIIKGERTVLAYLLQPMRDQMQRVFRE